ncbi:OmpA family protein [Maribacter sp. ACAM166]|uniref:OmpA family protein n=1 Tax=Maribacter sp. ACAM166 TaxID=2508996 RepID=UPI001484F906|nr:OmpA family protein [Maribacter sp. ACAM166]
MNPSFEIFVQCPVKLGNLEQDVENWKIPTLGSTDYFNGCSTSMGTPENFNGQQPANFGVGYVGFYMFAPDDYREYIQGALSTTLQKGGRYTISFYVSLAERSDFAVKEFGIRFSEFPVKVETSKVLSNIHFSKLQGDTSNQIEITYSKFYSDEKEWIKLTQEFVANGTENYILIGNFKNNRRTQKFQTKRKITKGSYYYVDMISVVKTDSKKIDSPPIHNFKLDSVHVFKDVLFGFNKAILKDVYQQELTSILNYLKLHTEVKIKISGHTDTMGSDRFNQLLSEKRAKSAADYFLLKGVEQSRIYFDGFGSSKPIASNKTKAGRLLNRRVEFVLLQ